jgi:predicted metal-dependent hydrolase
MFEVETIASPAGPCVLRRSARRTLAISVLPDGTIDLVAPRDSRPEEIAAKVGRRLRWIVRQRRVFAEMNRNRVPLRYESGASHRYLGRQYRLKVRRAERVEVKLVGGYFQVASKTGLPAEVQRLLQGWLREKAVEQFSSRLAKWEGWCRESRLPCPHLRLLRMPKRWGSSHRDGRIYLNPELVKAPSICIDYVITHEVCHLRHPRHDRAFFKLLDQLAPNWRSLKVRLETML